MNGWWLRLQCDWMESEWLTVLSAESRLAWIQILCLVKERGGKSGGRCKAMSASVFARRNYIGEEAVEQLLKAAKNAGALCIEDGEWIITGWDKYQNPETIRKQGQRGASGTKPDNTDDVPECPGHDGTSRDACHATPTETETIPPPPSEGSPKGAAQVRIEFDAFWDAYPKRSGDRKRAQAEKKFADKVRSGVPPGSMIEGAKRYAAYCDGTGKTGTELVQQATTWLNGRAWEEEFELPAEAVKRVLGADDRPERPKLDTCRKTGTLAFFLRGQKMTREEAVAWFEENDGELPPQLQGVPDGY